MTGQKDGKSTNVSVPAIERKDLHGLLEKNDLLTAFIGGTLLCASCAKVLNDANMGALLVRGGGLVPFCNSPDCIEEALQERSQ